MDQNNKGEKEQQVRTRYIPELLSVRDTVVILVAVVSLSAAFFAYDTRLTVVEHAITYIEKKKIDDRLRIVEQTLTKLKNDTQNSIKEYNETSNLLNSVNIRVREVEYEIKDIRRALKK